MSAHTNSVSAIADNAGTWISAIRTALYLPHTVTDRLYFNGRELKWLPRRLAGWFPVAVRVQFLQEAEEETVCAA